MIIIFLGIANDNPNVPSKRLFITRSFHTYNMPITPMERLMFIMLVHNKVFISYSHSILFVAAKK